jgi:hypothetical protein
MCTALPPLVQHTGGTADCLWKCKSSHSEALFTSTDWQKLENLPIPIVGSDVEQQELVLQRRG